jgi:CheY-like chemotaxis protein
MSDLRTNVLVVEDDATLRTLLSAVLSRSGYVVRSSHDGFSALKKIRSEMPDIVLSDLFMPGMSGFEFLSVVRRRYPSLRAVAMSSAYSGKTVPTGIAADAFYEKASNVLSLLEIVARIDEYRRGHAEQSPALSPIWIAEVQESVDGRCVVLSCTECMRTFSAPLDQHVTVVYRAYCPFCSMPTLYALVDRATPEAG